MQVFDSIKELTKNKNTILTLGTFDGIHPGHLKIIDKLVDFSKEKGCRNVVITFHPHPRTVLNSGNDVKMLTTQEERRTLLEKHGVENFLTINFTKEFASLTAEEFIYDYLVNGIGLSDIVLGHDHHFGKGRSGNVELLKKIGEKENFSVSTVDAFLDVKQGKEPFNSANYLSRIFMNQPGLFQFNLIGFQGHYLVPENLNKIKSVSNHVRLGNLRDDITLLEPVLRNTDFLSFDINSIKSSEAPGSMRINPNGLRSEEACQLAKYAGLSDRLKVFGLFDVFTENDNNNLTVKLASQLIWYFLEGYLNRDNENPDTNENNIIYQVEVDSVDQPIIFFRNIITNRWWMQIETTDKIKLHFACSEKEYEQASNNEIPEIWFNYIQKIDSLLK